MVHPLLTTFLSDLFSTLLPSDLTKLIFYNLFPTSEVTSDVAVN